ncbi:hypothetical protein E4U35_005116 [Claviceps purpurea]|nr:hypothetical protein E4U35_005116 [Claviceps purpurea]
MVTGKLVNRPLSWAMAKNLGWGRGPTRSNKFQLFDAPPPSRIAPNGERKRSRLLAARGLRGRRTVCASHVPRHLFDQGTDSMPIWPPANRQGTQEIPKWLLAETRKSD